MRKLCLALAAGAAILSTGALTSNSSAMTFGTASGLRGAIEKTAVVDRVGGHCTHFWNGHWHRFERCFWTPGHRHHRYFR
jgi:hypothetical protein